MNFLYSEIQNLVTTVRGIAILEPSVKASHKLRKRYLRPALKAVADIEEHINKAREYVDKETKDDETTYKQRAEAGTSSEQELKKELEIINEKKQRLFDKKFDQKDIKKPINVAYSDADVEELLTIIGDLTTEDIEKIKLDRQLVQEVYDLIENKISEDEEKDKKVEKK